ncbi:4Fe-4S protein [Desulfosporosinus orientis DSM 765]|uniref:4Fe-4S protein n=1 Tax=Desulfosporosinus orientis (strain ATCC 19365 / DSM 765 / NCIMB 8382 / VKM B-1628 / Singapore I) TaxID=768706 RepID=G7WJL1_DESOD|nr:4Fe-4S binding protein [Desulfosporosinus orientis]AET70448.1 4Fe-4S protein [Desulfosporosinus orientis DSM 765]
MDRINRFIALFGVPEFLSPHLSQFLSEAEINLVVLLDGGKYSISEIAAKLSCSLPEAEDLIKKSYEGHILQREDNEGEFVYFAADFYDRLDYICKFDENYPLISEDLRQALDQWCYEVYAERMDVYLDSLMNKEAVDRAPEMFMQVEEIDDVLNSVEDIRLVPCNCRKLSGRCTKPTETCLSFDNMISDRSAGRSLTKAEAKEIVEAAHRKGLMHQINSDWRLNGPAYICNCCSCCCYPLRLAQGKGTKGVFPIIQYAVQREEAKCSHCGACTRRCHFEAFHLGESEVIVNGKPRKRVELDLNKCWGCGICVEACPEKALSMVAV